MRIDLKMLDKTLKISKILMKVSNALIIQVIRLIMDNFGLKSIKDNACHSNKTINNNHLKLNFK